MDVAVEELPEEPVGALNRSTYRRYWMALYRRDVGAGGRIVDQWLRDWKPEHIYLRLFEPALNLSGKLWAGGSIRYQDEHYGSYHTLRFLRRVRHRFVKPAPTGPLAMATAAGQESHLIGLRMVDDRLQADYWRI